MFLYSQVYYYVMRYPWSVVILFLVFCAAGVSIYKEASIPEVVNPEAVREAIPAGLTREQVLEKIGSPSSRGGVWRDYEIWSYGSGRSQTWIYFHKETGLTVSGDKVAKEGFETFKKSPGE